MTCDVVCCDFGACLALLGHVTHHRGVEVVACLLKVCVFLKMFGELLEQKTLRHGSLPPFHRSAACVYCLSNVTVEV